MVCVVIMCVCVGCCVSLMCVSVHLLSALVAVWANPVLHSLLMQLTMAMELPPACSRSYGSVLLSFATNTRSPSLTLVNWTPRLMSCRYTFLFNVVGAGGGGRGGATQPLVSV